MNPNSALPVLIEVPTPCLASKFSALRIGSFELIQRWLSELSEDTVKVEDFSACLELLEPFFEDFVFLLAKNGLFDEMTYEGAKIALERIRGEPESVPDSLRRIVLGCLSQAIEEIHGTLLEEFHQRFKSLTVFVTEDGRIATGEYVLNQ